MRLDPGFARVHTATRCRGAATSSSSSTFRSRWPASTRRAARRSPGRWSPAPCILNRDSFPRGIDDSKNLPLDKARGDLRNGWSNARRGASGIATVEEIDQINIYWARMLAMSRAVEALGLEPAWVLVDGNATPRWQRPSKAIVDGDAKCRSIAAASIIAKVTRDRMMVEYADDYPGYGWEHNRGYPTPDHRRAINDARADPAAPPQLRPGARNRGAKRAARAGFRTKSRPASPLRHTTSR